MLRRFYEFLLIYFLATDIVLSNDYESLKARIETIERQLNEGSTKLEAVTETIENLETNINGTKKEMADNFQLQETYKENTNKEVNSLKTKTNDLEEITNVLSVEESCQQLSNLGFTKSRQYPIDPDGKSQNLNPIMAHCSLPDGKTTVGKPIKIDIDHCLTNLCFEKEVPYEEPMEQLQALISSSTKCTQDIIMLCLLAPIKLNGNDHLKWVDINGDQHTMTGISCNTPIPAWSNLTNTVTDKSILPITKVMYGPLIHEGQSASVVIGPIVCEGHNHVTLQSIVKTLTQDVRKVEDDLETELDEVKETLQKNNGNLETLETGLVEVKETLQKNKETLEKLEELHNLEFPCQTLGGKYKFILDRCYYFDTIYRTLSAAKAHCNNVFSSIGRAGKIFEPVDINTFNTIKKTAATFTTHWTWIGFVRSDATNWKRISDGLPATKVWGSKTFPTDYSSNPYLVFIPNSNSWDDECDDCAGDHNASVCEAI